MIFVDGTGKRFVDETADGEICARAQIRAGGGKKVTFALFNEAMISAMGTNDEVVAGLKAGRFTRGETLMDLARFLEIPPENLEKTVSDHNRCIREGIDPVWGKKGLGGMIPLENGPFYALSQWPAVHGTLGGLRINARAQVLDIRGNPIPRLYAAGEVTGGIHGSKRLPGNSIPACIVFGRIAGANAAEEKLPA
jgi:fumarate reductase flavoprotein subunit